MELWTLLVSLWLATWILVVGRTYKYIRQLTEEDELISKFNKLHAVIYSVSMFFITPFVWQIVIHDGYRENFVIAYVHAILGRTK